MYLADTLSRHYHTETTPGSSQTHRPQSQFEEELEHTQQIEEVNQPVATTETVLRFKEETSKNKTFKAVKAFVQKGRPHISISEVYASFGPQQQRQPLINRNV